MEYRMPTVTGHMTKWISPVGHKAIVDLLENQVDTKPLVDSPIDEVIEGVVEPECNTLWNWFEKLKLSDTSKVLIVEVSPDQTQMLYSGEMGDIPMSLAKITVHHAVVHTYDNWTVLLYSPQVEPFTPQS